MTRPAVCCLAVLMIFAFSPVVPPSWSGVTLAIAEENVGAAPVAVGGGDDSPGKTEAAAASQDEGESGDDQESDAKPADSPSDDGQTGKGNKADGEGKNDQEPKGGQSEQAAPAQETAPHEGDEPEKPAPKPDPEAERQKALSEEQSRLNLEYQVIMQRQKNQLSQMELEMKELQTKSALEKARHEAQLASMQQEIERLTTEARLENLRRERGLNSYKLEAEILGAQNEVLKQKFAEIKTKQDLEMVRFQEELAKINRALTTIDNKRQAKNKVLTEFEYRKEPFQAGTLIVSDRRIAMNGVITMATADYVTQRIAFFNNQSSEYPIFLVIDSSPGGSVMAGYRILKAMEGSEAPVHVVVKSFAASMAAIITTLADESYAYPNAVLLHHQMSRITFGNLRQIEEQLKLAQEWARRLMEPLAKKLGTTPEDFVRQMYEHNSDGDWEQFADQAVASKWVNALIHDLREQSVVENPDNRPAFPVPPSLALEEKIDQHGRRYVQLPRLEPFDGWFIYNPDNYYRP